MDPVKQVEETRKRAEIRAAARIIQLPLWNEDRRGIPNELVRSALFNVRNHRIKRRHLDNALIAVIGDGRITYTGMELRQDDQDIWLQLLHLARLQPLGEWVEFTPYSFLKTMGWPTTKHYYQKLLMGLSRMQATALMVYSKRLREGVSVSLVRKFMYQDEDSERLERWRVWIEPEMRTLFGEVHYTALEWEQRKHLGPIAKWLHGLFASHAKPFPMKIGTLKDGCGSGAKEMKHFKEMLCDALNELVNTGFLADWYIDNTDLVHVKRTNTNGI